MKIEFSKEQYRCLMELVYMGNWVIGAVQKRDAVKKYEELENYIYSLAKDFGLGEIIEYDEESGEFFAGKKFDKNTNVDKFIQDYDNDTFWMNLIDRLTMRDLIGKYGEDFIRKVDIEKILEEKDAIIDKYGDEFEKNSIENLIIRKQYKDQTVFDDEKKANKDNGKDADNNKKYIEGFVSSKYFVDLPAKLQKTAKSDVEFFLDCLNNYEITSLKAIRRHNVKSITTELFPKKVTAPPEEFRNFVPVFTAFFSYLKDKSIIKNADGIIEEIKECEEIMVKNAADPEYYGMSKTMAMQMLKENVDVSDQNAVQLWMAKFNARPYEERDKLFKHLDFPVPVPKSAVKIGRNEPCPCDSGKKYKKCCGV